MKIIIAGGGKVGAALVRQLSAEGHDLTVIDVSRRVLDDIAGRYDVLGLQGNCAAMPALLEAGVKDAQLLIAATSADEINLLCCTTAHGINPKLHTIARIRDPEYTDQIYAMRDLFGLSLVVNPEQQTAIEIERLLRYPGFLKRDTFAKGRAEIVELRVDANSRLRDVALLDLPRIVGCRVLVCAVLRGGTAITTNSGDFVLRENDRVFFTAPARTLDTLLKNLGIVTRRASRVMLCGGGRVSYYLAKRLEKGGMSVQIVEKDRTRAEQLAELLPLACVIEGDAGSQTLLDSEGLDQCSALVTLTGLDELNMILSIYGSSRGVPQIITKLGHAEISGIYDSLPLGSVLCPKELCAAGIVRYVRAMQNQSGAALTLHTIADGQVEALEFAVDKTTPYCGVPLKELKAKLRRNILLACISRGREVEIPNGDSFLQPGDTVVVVTGGENRIGKLGDIFA